MKNLLLSFLIGIALTTTVYAIEPNQEPPCCDVTENLPYEPNDEDEKLIIPEEAPPNEFVIMRPMTCRSIPDMVALLKDKNGEIPFISGDAYLVTQNGDTLPIQIMWSMNPKNSGFSLIELHHTTGYACLLGSGYGMKMHTPKESTAKIEISLDKGL